MLLRASAWLCVATLTALHTASAPSPLVHELELEVVALRRLLTEAESKLHAAKAKAQLSAAAAGPVSHTPTGRAGGPAPPPSHLPPGAYLESCTGCQMYGGTLSCQCATSSGGGGGRNPSSISTTFSCEAPLNITNEGGHLTCDWKSVPPPRVGNLTYFGAGTLPDIDKTCRILTDTTFFAPQYKTRGDPIASITLEARGLGDDKHARMQDAIGQCCRKCTADAACRAWTVSKDGGTCHLGSSGS
jgi:hypothetical protein|eukprot:COSAG01_NODE_9620_length_2387_cov_1.356206_3_plen_245_part_00